MGPPLPRPSQQPRGVDPGYGFEALENMTRWDWGQDLFEWFEYYLQERGPKPSLMLRYRGTTASGESRRHGHLQTGSPSR